MKNKFKKVSLATCVTLLLMFAFFTSLTLVSAAKPIIPRIITPATNGGIGGTYVFNATYNSTSSGNVSCYWYLKSANTANSSWTRIGIVKNSSSSATVLAYCNLTINLKGKIEDGEAYYVNVSINNATATGQNVTSGIRVDYTIPQAASSRYPSDKSTDTDGTVSFNGTVIDSNTTGCTLYFVGTNPGQSSYTMQNNMTKCNISLTGINEQSYVWYIQSSDGRNTTNSGTQIINVDLKTGGTKSSAISLIEEERLSVGGIPIVLIILVVVVVIIFIIIKRK